jgi:lipoate-protein ligase A
VAREVERESWRLITTFGAEPGFNMALDEALLEGHGAPPTLRFYTWKPDTLSLGYFQRFDDVPGAERAGAVVRRITGGGAIHHIHELTFSIAVSDRHPLYAGRIAESYARIHGAIAQALAEFEVVATPRGERALASDRSGTGMCFHHSTAVDLVWNDKKGVGSAQRRRGGRVLHHGSIKLGSSALEGDIATVGGGGRRVTAQAFAPILRASFEKSFGIVLEAGVPDVDERTRARALATRYLDPAFVRRR